jgi:pimeloyl-ACP methyl ester carboxylesterase
MNPYIKTGLSLALGIVIAHGAEPAGAETKPIASELVELGDLGTAVITGYAEKKARDFNTLTFKMDGYESSLLVPHVSAQGNPWIWRTSFPSYHREVDLALVGKGFHVAHIGVVKMLGADASLDIMDKFYELLRRKWSLAEKPALEGVSRGGLHAYRYAARHPERIACIYADVPVMDLKSWPLRPEAKAALPLKEAMSHYGFANEEELKAYRGNPVDLLEPIAKAKIPLRHVVSMNDEVVPPEQNTLEAQRRLQALGWDIDVVRVQEGDPKSKGHRFPVPEVEETVAFIIKHSTKPESVH